MTKKLGLLSTVALACAGLVFSIGSPAGAGMAFASPDDTCYGSKGTVIRPTGTEKRGNLVYQVFQGSPGDDVIIGTDGPDIIMTNGGHDTICARGGNDIVTVNLRGVSSDTYSAIADLGFGNDTLTHTYPPNGGDRFDDGLVDGSLSVQAGPGDDYLNGGAGSDNGFFDYGGRYDMNDDYTVGTAYCAVGQGQIGRAVGCNWFVTWEPVYSVYQPEFRKATTTTTTRPQPPVTTTTANPTPVTATTSR